MRTKVAFKSKIAGFRFYEKLLKAVKRNVREVQGPEPKDLKAYYRRYAREIESSKPARSSFRAFINRASKAKVVLVGDFHTLDQAQKQFLKVAREMEELGMRPVLCLEMVHADKDGAVADYIKGDIGDADFLDGIGFFDHWGFDFNHYKPVFDFARKTGSPVHGINREGGLKQRDRFMAARIAELAAEYGDRPLLVMVGDLHLSRNNLPKNLIARGLDPVVLFQNSEKVYMGALRHGSAPEGWWALGQDRYLVNNTPPWVKMQTYCTWLEHGGEALCSMYGMCKWRGMEEEDEEVDLTETLHEYIRVLKSLFGLFSRNDDEFQVFTMNDLEFLEERYFKTFPGKVYAQIIRDGRPLYMVWSNTIYIPILDVNRTAQEAAHFLMGRNLNIDDGRAAFMDRIHYYASGFIASKLINPLRKGQRREEIERFVSEYEKSRPWKEKRYLSKGYEAARMALAFLQELGHHREFPAPFLSELTVTDRRSLYSVSEMLGRVIGEDLYSKYDGGLLSGEDLKQFIFQQHNPLRYFRP